MSGHYSAKCINAIILRNLTWETISGKILSICLRQDNHEENESSYTVPCRSIVGTGEGGISTKY